MNHDQFVYWLQGFVEMNGGKSPTKQQWQIIQDHLKLCFVKLTPAVGGGPRPDLNCVPIGPYKPYENSMPATMFPAEFIPHGGFVRNSGGGAC